LPKVTPTILITGANGFLGSHLFPKLSNKFSTFGIVRKLNSTNDKLNECDLSDSKSLVEILNKIKPEIVIHTAACSALSFCEQNPMDSYLTNVRATQTISDWATIQNSNLIFTSTDQVFDGKKSDYKEEDIPNPISEYGKQKLEAEKIVLQNPENVVLRLPLLIGIGKGERKGTLHQMVEQIKEGKSLNLFTDEYRTPLSADEVVRAIEFVIENKLNGLFHISGDQRINRYELGLLIAKRFNLHQSKLISTTREKAGMENRPRDVSLNNEKLKTAGFYPKSLDEMLSQIT
jgi:dTDP-4-dehydrorhamnose reductase